MRLTSRHAALVLLVAIAAGCDNPYAAQNPLPTEPPPETPPPPGASLQPGLWTASGSPAEVLRLDPAQLLTNGFRDPATNFFTSSASLFTLNSIAFDTDGTVWVASQADSMLLSFSPATANKSGFAAAKVVISPKNGSISAPTGIAFDRQHNLWVANSANGTLVRFNAAQLLKSGAPVPAVVLSGLGHPTSIAFDAVGALWVSDNQANTVSRFLVGQLLASGAKDPAVVLSSNSNSLRNPSGIAFDATGKLWVANSGNATIAAFSPTQRGASGSPVPDFVVQSGHGPLIIPVGIAFDDEGSLWVMGGDGGLEKFDPAALTPEGPFAPSVRIIVNGHVSFWSVAFWPKPAGLPLN